MIKRMRIYIALGAGLALPKEELMAHGKAGAAVKGEIVVRKWNPGRTPADGEPDEIVTVEQWQEDGQVVTEPERIAELEALAEQQKGQA